MVGEPVEQSGGHFGVAEDGGPFSERQVRGDDDRGPLVEPADQMEEELAASLGDYPAVARLGGAVWVGLLSLIVSMPVVTDRVKRRVSGRG